MEILRGTSKKTVKSNILELIRAGHSQDQSVAIAMESAGKSRSKGKKKGK